MKRKIINNVFFLAVLVVVGYFFSTSLGNNWEKVKDIQLQFNVLSIIALVLLAGTILLSGYLWGLILQTLSGKKLPAVEAMRVQALSWLLKYIPGQVGSLISKIVWGKKNGYSKKLILVTYIYENTFLLLASLVPAAIILLSNSGLSKVFLDNKLALVLPMVAVLPLLLIANKKSFSFMFNFLFAAFTKQHIASDQFLSTGSTLKLQLAFLLPRVLNAVAFVCIAATFLPISASSYLPLGAAYVLAGAVGIMAIFVPSGIGVRELVIVLFASAYLPIEQAVILSLVARLYSTLADGLVAIFYFATRNFKAETT